MFNELVCSFKENAIQQREDNERKEKFTQVSEVRRLARETVTDKFMEKISEIVSSLNSVCSEQNSMANFMNEISDKTSGQVSCVSVAIRQTSDNVKTVATATEELSRSIGEVGQEVGQASQASIQAVEEVENTSGQMAALAENANRIGEIVDLISGVAEQRNLLALMLRSNLLGLGNLVRGLLLWPS